MSTKNSNDLIGNRTRDLPACSAVPQPTAPPRAPKYLRVDINIFRGKYSDLLCGVFNLVAAVQELWVPDVCVADCVERSQGASNGIQPSNQFIGYTGYQREVLPDRL
jgi:hypothetical protein